MLLTNFATFRLPFIIGSLLLFTSAIPLKDNLTEDVLKFTNQFRRSKGLAALEMRDDLNKIAKKHSEDMASGRKNFGHGGYNQRVLQVRKSLNSFTSLVAENVAYGASSGKQAVDIWKNSSAHRKNMLGNYKYIGIGIARSRRGIIYYTQILVR
jgi:uncharacterized protein YkwD